MTVEGMPGLRRAVVWGACILLVSSERLLAAGASPVVPGAAPASPTGGPFVRMVRHNDGSRSITARDDTTKEMVITTYDPLGNLKLRRNYQLDRFGKPATFIFYDGAGKPLVRGEYVYDAQDRVAAERWFELPTQKPILTLAQNYDAKGRRLPPQSMHEATLPPEVVRWLEPDKAQVADKKASEKGRLNLNPFKKKDKKEPEAPPPGTPAAPAPGGKGPLHGLFGKPKK